MIYYTYVHKAGYGRDDHMAFELLARAARGLGYETGNAVAQAVGLASHPVGQQVEVRAASAPGTRARLERALKDARAELPFRADLRIDIECHRYRFVRDSQRGCFLELTERRDGARWIEIARTVVDQ